LYGLKQAPRQWYERLINFLLSHGYEIGKIDKTLFIKKSNSAIIFYENQENEVFIDEGRDHSPSHLKFFLLVFSKLKEDIK